LVSLFYLKQDFSPRHFEIRLFGPKFHTLLQFWSPGFGHNFEFEEKMQKLTLLGTKITTFGTKNHFLDKKFGLGTKLQCVKLGPKTWFSKLGGGGAKILFQIK
jgi:hypothetical protein